MPMCQQVQVWAKAPSRRKCHSQLKDRRKKVQEPSVVGPKQSGVLKAALPGWVALQRNRASGQWKFFSIAHFHLLHIQNPLTLSYQEEETGNALVILRTAPFNFLKRYLVTLHVCCIAHVRVSLSFYVC